MGLWEDSLSEVLLGGICLAYSHFTLVRLPMIFPAFLLWRYRVACTVPLGQAGRYFLQEVPSLLLNYQLIFSSTSSCTSR